MSEHLCANCGLELEPDPPGTARTPCPRCGGTARTVAASGALNIGVYSSVEGTVTRGINEVRMASFTLVLAVSTSVGLSIGLATSSWVVGPIAGLATAVTAMLVLALVYRVKPVTKGVMALMHWVTGR